MAAEEPDFVPVFKSGTDGYAAYRIPTAIQTKRGTLLVFCEGRKNNLADFGNIDIVLKRSTDGGKTWSAMQVIADLGEDTAGNPGPVQDRSTGTIWLLLTKTPGQLQEQQIVQQNMNTVKTVWVTHSNDEGQTWSPLEDITSTTKDPTSTWYVTGPANGIQTKSGRLVVPGDFVDAQKRMFSHVIYSDDHGKTWQLGGSAGPQCNEASVAERSDGTLLLNMRSYAGKNRRAVSESTDGGLTWSEPKLDEALIEPVCQGSLILGVDSDLYFSNPASTQRRNLTVKRSTDGGKTWTSERVVFSGQAAYSNLIPMNKGTLGVVFEHGVQNPYQQISFARIQKKSFGKMRPIEAPQPPAAQPQR